MTKYIISIDFGSSNAKYLIMKVDGDVISVHKKDYIKSNDVIFIEKELEKIMLDMKIDMKGQLEIVCSGAKAESLNHKYLGKEIYVVNEFDALSYGVLLPMHLESALISSVGTGTCFIYSDLHTVEHISGTGMGGGPLTALGIKTFNEKDILKVVDKIKDRDLRNIDLFISDLSNNDSYENLGSSLTASNLVKIENDASNEDYVLGLYNMICQNIGIEAILSRKIVENEKKIKHASFPIVITGTVTGIPLIRKLLDRIAKDLGEEFVYVKDPMFTNCIGAYEYYLINERKNF